MCLKEDYFVLLKDVYREELKIKIYSIRNEILNKQ
jgi:hypothetical protein